MKEKIVDLKNQINEKKETVSKGNDLLKEK